MKKAWSYDSPLISKANILADFIFLNIVYLLCCLPIITIGPATAALYSVSFHFLKKEDHGVKPFLKLFWENLRSFLLPWLAVLLLGAFLLFDAYQLFIHPIPGAAFFAVVLAVLVVVYAMVLAQVFLVQARFVCKFRYILTNAIFISLAHPVRSVAVLVLELLPLGLFLFWPSLFVFLTPVLLLAYFSVSAYGIARIMRPVYDGLAERREQEQ